jgi:hypothetical protein
MFYIKSIDSASKNYEIFEVSSYRVDYDYPIESGAGNQPHPPRVSMTLADGARLDEYMYSGKEVYVMNSDGKTIDRVYGGVIEGGIVQTRAGGARL